MKPVVIFRHALTEGAGYLGTFLEQHAIPWCEVRIDKGYAVPERIDDFSGMVLMGGPMSVNDDLPWIPPLLRLIRESIDKDIPVLGHCLGAQLISKALGGVVSKNTVKEIGWGQVQVLDNLQAKAWFGDLLSFKSFHWHGETFTLPQGATHILASEYCANQAYVMGKHIGLQCHIEMVPEMVKVWCQIGADEFIASATSPAVQTAETMQQTLMADCAALNAVADRIYTRWVQGLVG